jgi:hypothetical protein
MRSDPWLLSLICAGLLASAVSAAALPCVVAQPCPTNSVSSVAVSLEMRVVRMPEQAWERIGVDFESDQGGTLDQERLRRTMRLAKEEQVLSVTSPPTVTCPDKQRVNVQLAQEGVDAAPRITPRVSADRRFVRLSLRLRRDGAEDENVKVVLRDGGSFGLPVGTAPHETRQEFAVPVLSRIPYVNRLFKNVGYGRETKQVFLVVIPHIFVQQDGQ